MGSRSGEAPRENISGLRSALHSAACPARIQNMTGERDVEHVFPGAIQRIADTAMPSMRQGASRHKAADRSRRPAAAGIPVQLHWMRPDGNPRCGGYCHNRAAGGRGRHTQQKLMMEASRTSPNPVLDADPAGPSGSAGEASAPTYSGEHALAGEQGARVGAVEV